MSLTRSVKTIIEKKDDSLRLDRWLAERFTYHSRKQWQDIIKKGEITVNSQMTRASKILRTGDIIEFNTKDYEEPEVNFNYSIIYEDDYMLAINKPGNLPCHPAGRYFYNTLFTHLSEKIGHKIYLINRLDRETSGIVLFAKSSKIANQLSGLFTGGQIKKEYLAIVHGSFPKKLYACGYLINDEKSSIRKKRKFVPVNDKNKDLSGYEVAETDFELIKTSGELSYIKAIPKTGRLHQIRATLCSLGYPVAGDKIYGLDDTIYLRFIEGQLTKEDKQTLILDRQALHATTVTFEHPVTHKKTVIRAHAKRFARLGSQFAEGGLW